MNKLLKDAIADAKAVRETALANAKVALEEAFAPKLQSMLSHKIKEEMEDDEDSMKGEEMEDEGMNRMMRNAGMSEEDEDTSDDYSEEMPSEEMPSEEMPSEEMPAEDDYSEEEESSVDDADLEELIRELEGEEEEMPSDEEDNLEEVDDFFFESEDPDKMETEGKKKKMMENEDEDEEEVDLEEVIRALREEDEEEEAPSKSEEELEEAYKVIKFLRSKLNEVNLLNAKLLFVNKLFKKGQLSETQKVKIIETFDRAKNVREAKLIYTTLAESVNKTATATKKITKKPMMEGFASAPQKSTKIITESNGVYNRFKELVNFNK